MSNTKSKQSLQSILKGQRKPNLHFRNASNELMKNFSINKLSPLASPMGSVRPESKMNAAKLNNFFKIDRITKPPEQPTMIPSSFRLPLANKQSFVAEPKTISPKHNFSPSNLARGFKNSNASHRILSREDSSARMQIIQGHQVIPKQSLFMEKMRMPDSKKASPQQSRVESKHQSPEPRSEGHLETAESEQYHLKMFKFYYVIGKGGFGKVWMVELLRTKTMYAMKTMSKAKVIQKKSVHSVMNERHLLATLKNPFLANIHFSFQSRNTLYLVMDLLTGGDLRYHMARHRRFSEFQTKFILGCIILGLEYLHSHNIIHRDIKPENLVFDKQGYIHITDLGIARVYREDNSADSSGTPSYMCPEVMFRQSHSYSADYYALGVIAYEFVMGKRPYIGRSRKEVREGMLASQAYLRRQDLPQGWSADCSDFVSRLIQRKAALRLGSVSIEEIKHHPWFSNFPWGKLQRRELPSPYVPQEIEHNQDYLRQISSTDEAEEEVLIRKSIENLELRRTSFQAQFDGYNYESICKAPENTGSTLSTRVNSILNSAQS